MSVVFVSAAADSPEVYTDQFVVRVDGGPDVAKELARKHGFTFTSKVSDFFSTLSYFSPLLTPPDSYRFTENPHQCGFVTTHICVFISVFRLKNLKEFVWEMTYVSIIKRISDCQLACNIKESIK